MSGNSRPFVDFLREHRGGVTHDDLSDKLQELVAAVSSEGKGGTLTLVIRIKPANAGSGALVVNDEIKLTKPKESRSGSIFFVSPENNLIRNDPKQCTLPLGVVQKGDGPAQILTAFASALA